MINGDAHMTQPVEVIVGEVRHTRMAPKRHAFEVASFCLRLDMKQLAQIPVSPWFAINKTARFSVQLSDYGTRKHDGCAQTLLGQIYELVEQADMPVPAGKVYLHTFPRMLGYVFNPVSFWYLHREDGALGAIVCEVNNTFGERHFYVLGGQDGQPIAQGQQLTARKEFHVSPFFDVQGRYRFRFYTTPSRVVARIDLDNELGHALVTSISGRRIPADNALWRSLLWTYRWFTLGVIVKIHWEALKLFAKGMHFFSKPAPPSHIATRSSH